MQRELGNQTQQSTEMKPRMRLIMNDRKAGMNQGGIHYHKSHFILFQCEVMYEDGPKNKERFKADGSVSTTENKHNPDHLAENGLLYELHSRRSEGYCCTSTHASR